MSRIGGLIADEYKTPYGFYQLTCTDSDQSITIPWIGRSVQIYCRDKDARINFNESSGSSTYFIAAGQTIKLKLPYSSTTGDPAGSGCALHGRNNASGQEATLMIYSFHEQT